MGRSSRKAGSGAHPPALRLLCCRSLAESVWTAGGHNWTSWMGVTVGCSTLSSSLWGNRALLQPSRVSPTHPSAGTGVQGSDAVASGTWWPQALAEPMTVSTRKQSMDGCSPSSAGLNVTLQNTFTATVGADNGTCAAHSCPVTSIRQEVPGSGIIPSMGSMQGVHALTGLIRPVKAPPANQGQGETHRQKV